MSSILRKIRFMPSMIRLLVSTNKGDFPAVQQQTTAILDQMNLQGPAREQKRKDIWSRLSRTTKNSTMAGLLGHLCR